MTKNQSFKKKAIVDLLRNEKLQASDIAELITNIKKTRMYQDPEIAGLLLKTCENFPEIARFQEEILAMLALEKCITEKIVLIGKYFESPQEELSHTMLALEETQRQLFNLPQWSECQVNIQPSFLDCENYKSEFDELISLDYFLSYFTIALKSLLGKIGDDGIGMLTADKLTAAFSHIPLASEWAVFHERRSFWEHNCTTTSIQDSTMVFDSANDPLVLAFRISLTRLRAFRLSRKTDKLNVALIKSNTCQLPMEEFRSKDELMSCYLTSLQFYSKDMSEVIYDAKLCEWIRAYTMLKEAALHHVRSNQKIGNPIEMFLRGSKNYFVDLLQQGGLSAKVSKTIVGHLTFNGSSRDILDTPLFPIGGDLIIIPSVTAQIEPAFSLESLLKSIKDRPNHELSIIGPGLEVNLKNDLKKAGIKAKKISIKNFDCDIAFVLDSVLFLCECKGRYQVSDFRSYIDLENFLRIDTVTQHRRTCHFFENNMNHVRHALNLPLDWTPRKVVKLIVTSAKLGRVISENEFLILDENIFHGFFSRKKPHIIDASGKIIRVHNDTRLMGAISADDFLSYISSPPVISIFNELKATREIVLQNGSSEIVFRDLECYGEAKISIER